MFLGWIPIVGPIIDGVVSMFKKYQDTELGKRTIDADVKKAEIAASTETLRIFRDNIGVRITRDLIMFPVAVWTGLIVWDKIVDIPFPSLVWGVKPLDASTGLDFLPYAVITFLFGIAALNTWKTK